MIEVMIMIGVTCIVVIAFVLKYPRPHLHDPDYHNCLMGGGCWNTPPMPNVKPAKEEPMRIFNPFKRKPKCSLNQKAQDLMVKMNKDGHSLITIMCEINALCGLCIKENDVAHALGELHLPLPKLSKDSLTPVPPLVED